MYAHYDTYALQTIISRPRDICREPYKLLTSYLVNCIIELVEDTSDETEEDMSREIRFDKDMLDKYIADCLEDFRQSAAQENPIRIGNHNFAIYKADTIDYSTVRHILNFPEKDGEYILGMTDSGGKLIVKTEYICDVEHGELSSYEEKKLRFKRDRLYFWKIVQTVMQSESGWDNLTDMEAATYCWAKWMTKMPTSAPITDEKIQLWWEEYYDCFYIPLREIKYCIHASCMEHRNKLNSLYPFDSQRVEQWNNAHQQTSIISNITDKSTEDYWYSSASVKFQR